jgi:uncharacterized protein with HEPN domain
VNEDLAYIEHILDCIAKIEAYTENLDIEDFVKNNLVIDATIRNFEVIGEATKMISENLKQSYFEIPWKEMTGMRDKLIHDYLGVDVDVIWETIQDDIPLLKEFLNKIIRESSPSE